MKFGLSEEIYNKIKKIVNKYQYTFRIFGSRARGNYKYNSDIDIAVYGDVTEKDEFNILNEFDMLDIPNSIDIVFIQKINKEEFLASIKRDGVDI